MADLDPNVDWVYVNNLVNQIRTLYPNMAWMLNIPDLSNVLIRAGMEQWDEGRIVAAIQATDWWKARNESARNQEKLFNTDPASWEQQKQGLATEIKKFASLNGIAMTNDEAQYIAQSAITKGQTADEWQSSVVNEFIGNRGGKSPVVGDTLERLAAEYAVPMSTETLRQWEQQILTGMADENTFRAYLQEQAKSLFPGLANAIDRGITVRQYVAPYQEIAVQELGINPADIDWRDPKWSRALHNVDAKTGSPVSLSLSDWTRELRSNPVYGFDSTIRAQEQAGQLGNALLQRLGMAA